MNRITAIGGVFSVGLLAVLAGCGSPSDSKSSSGGDSFGAMAGQVDAQAASKKQDEAAVAAKAAADQQAAAAAAAANPPELEKKAVGSRPPMEGGGYLRAIGSARRHVMNVADSLSWIQGVRSFKAEEDRKPKDNNEFMKVVVTKYELQLPHIEADEEYLYDPNGESDGDFGQLYVVKKQTPGDSAGSPPPGAPAPGQK